MTVYHNTLTLHPRFEILEKRLLLTGQSWDLFADFDLLQNSDGPWSYSAGAADGELPFTPQLMPLVAQNWQGIGVEAWTLNGDSGAVPGFGVATVDHGGGLGQLAGDLLGHSSVVVRWTSTLTGTVNVSGAAYHPRTIGRITSIVLFENGPTSQGEERHILGKLSDTTTRNAPMEFSRTVDVVAGQQVDLIFGPGQVEFFGLTRLVVEIATRGDYNGDGTTDAADYTVWRNNLGQTGAIGSLAGDGTGANLNGTPDGVVDLWDYQYWKAHYGETFVLAPTPPDPAYHPTAVIVQTSGVTLPDGSQLDISGSQTDGLQEAFDYAANEGWSLFVLPGTYSLNAHIDVAPLQLRTFRFEDVVLNFSNSVTDFGIRFDSTMLVNWYWKGGAINAPNAATAVLFQPRSPHPLDGIILGTKGVVDSEFHFNVDITARPLFPKVTMNTQQATINDLVYYFKDVSSIQFRRIGNGFANYNIAAAPRTDDPIPFELFDTAGRVTVLPVNTEAGTPSTVYLPDGSRLSVVGTRTSGLQEAFDHAAANNLDLLVFGRGIRNVAPFSNFGLYNMTEPLVVGDLNDRLYAMYAVTWGNPGTEDLLTMGDMVNSRFEFTGQIVGPVSENVVVIRPDDFGINSSSIKFQAVVGNNELLNSAVRIDPGMASIEGNELVFHEVNMGYFGIKVMNPSPTTEFENNLLRTLHTHASAHVAVQLGEGVSNSSRIHSNQVQVRTSTDSTYGEVGFQVWGDSNNIDLYVFNSGPGVGFGAKFEPGSNDNVLRYGTIQATISIADFGTNNSKFSAGAGAGGLSITDLIGNSLAFQSLSPSNTADQLAIGRRQTTASGNRGYSSFDDDMSFLLALELANQGEWNIDGPSAIYDDVFSAFGAEGVEDPMFRNLENPLDRLKELYEPAA